MPFITQERRALIAEGKITEFEPGDRCYIHYKRMLEQWNESPRWTTAHSIYVNRYEVCNWSNSDDEAAAELAWQVFFTLHVLPYELAKRQQNGEVE